MQRKLAVFVAVSMLSSGVAAAQVDCTPNVPKPRIILRFDGVVDLVSPARSTTSAPWALMREAWVVAPDMYVPTDLPVVKNHEIKKHVASLVYATGEILSDKTSPQILDNHEIEVHVPGKTAGGVAQHRETISPGNAKPSTADRCSLEWLADLDALSPSSRLRPEVIEGETELLAFRLRLTDGWITTGSFHLTKDNKSECVVRTGVETRALAKSFQVAIPVDPTERKVILSVGPLFGSGAVDRWSFALPQNKDEAVITIGNHPASISGQDFRAHYALRSGWDSSGADPTLPGEDCLAAKGKTEPPAANPMCSPGDDGWP